MRKALLVLIFYSLVLSGQGQTLQWGLNVAPGVSYRIPQTQSLSPQAESIQIGEEAMYVFDFGLDVRKSIGPRMGFGTGIIYSQKGFSNTHVAAIFDDPSLNRRYLIDFVQDYLEVPFFLTYELLPHEQFSIYSLGGITNSLLLKSKNSVSATSGEINEETMERLREPYLENKVNHNLGIMAGIGIMTDVDSKTALGIEAVGKVMTSPLLDQVTNTQRRLYSLNLNFRFVRKIH